jgi:hypothetical protein
MRLSVHINASILEHHILWDGERRLAVCTVLPRGKCSALGRIADVLYCQVSLRVLRCMVMCRLCVDDVAGQWGAGDVPQGWLWG